MHTPSIIPMYVPMHTPFTSYLLFRIYDSQINHAWNCFPLWVGVWMVTYTVIEWNIDSVYQSFSHLKLIYSNHLYSINSKWCCPEIPCPQYIPLYFRWSPSRFLPYLPAISLKSLWNPQLTVTIVTIVIVHDFIALHTQYIQHHYHCHIGSQ